MYIIHLKYIKSNKKKSEFLHQAHLFNSIIILFLTFVRFWLYFSVIFQFFMFYYYLFNHLSFLLLFTVCTSFVFGANSINLVQLTENFCNLPLAKLLQSILVFIYISILFAPFYNLVHLFIIWCKFFSKILIIIFLVQRNYAIIIIFLYNL